MAQVGSIDVDRRCATPDASNGPLARINAVVPPLHSLAQTRGQLLARTSRPPSAGCKPCESLVMFRAVISRSLTIWLNDQGNTMFTNLSEPIW